MPPMRTTALPDAFRRALRWLALAGLVALAGCGPGTGGTGTGPLTFTVGPAIALNVNQDPYAALTVRRSDETAACEAARLTFDDASVELLTTGPRFTRYGAWQADASHLAVLDGWIDAGTSSGRGALRLQFDAEPQDSTQVTVTLQDAGGAVLAGPLVLRRGAQGATAAADGTACR